MMSDRDGVAKVVYVVSMMGGTGHAVCTTGEAHRNGRVGAVVGPSEAAKAGSLS